MSNSIMVDLDDSRIGKIADVISNKTAKKILNLLGEKEMSVGELSDEVKQPMNTIAYNVDKLEEVGLIEKVGGFLWSVKGKRIHRYKLSNKKIVITPRSLMKGVIPAVLISGVIGIGLWSFENFGKVGKVGAEIVQESEGALMFAKDAAMETASNAAPMVGSSGILSFGAWAWFLLGAWAALLIFVLWSVIKRK